MSYSIGDIATLKLTVIPNDGTTTVAVSVKAPDGTVSSPGVTGGPQDWQAMLTLAQAGLYIATWTVTGTGAGVQQHRFGVSPNGPVSTGWATTADLANWLQAAPPVDADRLLARASQRISDRVVGGYYVDTLDMPTDTVVKNALRDAACAQVEQWLSVGEDADIDGYPQATRLSAGGVSVSRRPAPLAPRARLILRDAGLLSTRAS